LNPGYRLSPAFESPREAEILDRTFSHRLEAMNTTGAP
jgi:hypothetical protein